jgi:superfamily I DNA/RNA helicase
MPHDPTPEQQAIFDAALSRPESLLVNAYAGTGKTTTMEMMAWRMDSSIPAMALAFNKLIATELEKRFPKHFVIKTFNGLGHGAWGRSIGKRLILDDRKVGRLVTQLFKDEGFQGTKEDWASVKDLVTAAQNAGLVPKDFSYAKGLVPDTPEQWALLALDQSVEPKFIPFAQQVLFAVIKEAVQGLVSFDDQIYMSALFGGVFPRYPAVIVDESQDLSPLNHIQVQKVAAGRLFVVGDRKQAIYAFRGADHQSMDKLKLLRKEWIELPLFTTFRCPKTVVARAQAHAPGFTAFHKNIEGQIIQLPKRPSPPASFLTIEEQEAEEKPVWHWHEVAELGDEIAILCRNNAPLLSMAFKLLRRGVGCKMLGRDIGKGLVLLAKKILPNPDTKLEDCIELINHWRQLELAKASALGQESKLDGIHDRAESLLAVAEHAMPPTADFLILALQQLFARDAGQVVLSSGHKSKGLEWDVVLHLDPWRIPSKWATSESEKIQEANLRYVIETRPKRVLVLANVEDFR